jgi:nicotinamide-nucleotide adenylyltransferase
MSSTEGDLSSMSQLLQQFQSSLKSFASSYSTFQLLRSVPASRPPSISLARTLYVLDSSFNPPTTAHLRIASSALEQDPRGAVPKRLLLLLATQNADKASKPAAFEHRLVMMTLFAHDLQFHLRKANAISEDSEGTAIDIGVTKKPYFHDKATAISESNIYLSSPEQVHLTGFDTIIRIFNPKYYQPEHTLAPLEPFLNRHRIRVTYRPDDEWGGREEQDAYVEAFRRGDKEDIGGKKEWAERIDLVEGKKPEKKAVSSTKARKAALQRSEELGELVTPSVKDWILSQGLYVDEVSKDSTP